MIRLFGVVVIAGVVAGCQGVPADYRPDPSLKTASVSVLRSKIAAACVISQRARSSASTDELQSKCGCYAGKTWQSLNETEVNFYRSNGYFDDTARTKASAALSSCKLTPV